MRLLLAENNDHVPVELLLELWREWEGLSQWRIRKRIPREGLRRFADDPNLHRDAAADPRLPLSHLLEALEETRLAAAAARNPALPLHVMHELLDRAGVAGRP